jgi:flagellar assembly protein FliH
MSSKARRLSSTTTVSAVAWTNAASRTGLSSAPVSLRDQLMRMPSVPKPVPAPSVPAMPAPATPEVREAEAYARGVSDGERMGAAAVAGQNEALLQRLTETLVELRQTRSEMIRQTERQLVELALAVARRVLHREVSLEPDLLVAMIRVALDRLGEAGQVTIRLHPAEFEAVSVARSGALAGDHVAVVADARVGRGGCRVESDYGSVDAGVDAQIQEIGRVLLGDEERTAHDTRR